MRSLRPFSSNDLTMDNGFRNFYNMIDDFFDNRFTPDLALKEGSFRVDIREDTDKYLVEAELPGYDKDEIKLSIEDGKLTINACKNEEIDKSDESKNYIHKERKTSKVSRTMYFEDVDQDKLKAKLEDGILTVSLPKMENNQKVKLIDIQ